MPVSVIKETCHLPVPPDVVWDAIQRPATLVFISKGRLTLDPVDLPEWPERWREGAYRCRLRGPLGIPLGWQVIRISFPPAGGPRRFVRDNGHGALVRVWDHVITIEPDRGGTRYTDAVRIDAGVLTPLVRFFARDFYKHRQRRLAQLLQGLDG